MALFVMGWVAVANGELEKAEREFKTSYELMRSYIRIPATGQYYRHKVKVRCT